MGAFVGKPIFCGSWGEDLYNTVNKFETLSMIFEITAEENCVLVTIILSSGTLNCFANNIQDCSDFDGAMQIMRLLVLQR